MAADGFFPEWYAGGWFPAVWFAPGDESHLLPEELQVKQISGMFPNPFLKKRHDEDELVLLLIV